MPKIENWTRIYPTPDGFYKAWVHEQTGEKMGVSKKVLGDGYYTMSFMPDEEVEVDNGDEEDFAETKAQAYDNTYDMIRANIDGLGRVPMFNGELVFKQDERLAVRPSPDATLHLVEQDEDDDSWSACGLDNDLDEDSEMEYVDEDSDEICGNCSRLTQGKVLGTN